MPANIVPLDNISEIHLDYVGDQGKLSYFSLPVSPGFVILPSAFIKFQQSNKLSSLLHQLLSSMDITSPPMRQLYAEGVSKVFDKSTFPKDLSMEIFQAFHNLCKKNCRAIVSCGPFESQTVEGDTNLLISIKNFWEKSLVFQTSNILPIVSITVQLDLPHEKSGLFISTEIQNNSDLDKISALIKKHFYFPQQIFWFKSGQKYYIKKIIAHAPLPEKLTIDDAPKSWPRPKSKVIKPQVDILPPVSQVIATKLIANYSSTTTYTSPEIFTSSGIIFSQDDFLLEFGYHPKAITGDFFLKNKFSTKLANTLKDLGLGFFPRPILYKFSSQSQAFYRSLKHGHLYEQTDDPKSHSVGVERYLYSSDFLDLELSIIKKIKRQNNLNIKYVVPQIRTPDQIANFSTTISSKSQNYILLSLAANLLYFDSLLPFIDTAVVLDLDRVTEGLFGLPPLSQTEMIKKSAFSDLLSDIFYKCKQNKIETWITSHFYSNELLEYLVGNGVTGLIANANDFTKLRSTISNLERQLITYGSN